MHKVLHPPKAIYKITVHFMLVLALVCLGSVNALAVEQEHKEITQKLINLLEEKPEVKEMLKASLKKARITNPDPVTNPAQTLPEYYDFIDSASELIPQEMLANAPSLIREQILQSICYFYFLIDQPLPRLKAKGLFRKTIQYYKPFADWTRDFADSWGDYLDTEASWTQKTYQQFYSDPSFGLQNNWYKKPSSWKTFNEFFSRHLISPSVRPIAAPTEASVVVSPADSVPQGVWPIDSESKIKVEDGLKVKLTRFYSVEELLGHDSKYKKAFANGTLTHTFLNVNDYHRYHFAVGGIVKEIKSIQQNASLEVIWDPKTIEYAPIDSTGWQFTQTRGYVIVETKEYGLVALMPMGMAQVSSVNFEESVKVGSHHNKGDMLGTFLFGGSDFVMLFQKKAGFEISAPKSTDSDSDYNHLLMGEAYGIMKGQ